MAHSVTKVHDGDGSWQDLERQWNEACEALDQDFDEFRQGRMEVLKQIAKTFDDSTFVCGVVENNVFEAIFMANFAAIKGYSEKVLRIRHITFGPTLDYSGAITDYVLVLTKVLNSVIEVSRNIKAQNVKIHASSPYDAQLFSALSSALSEVGMYKKVEFKGMWLYITI